MKRILMSIAIVAFSITATQAQENKTVKEESTIKRVVTKEGSEVKVKEIKKTDVEKGAVIVKDDNKTNQAFKEATKKDSDNKVIVSDVVVNEANEQKRLAIKERQQAELEIAIKAQKEKNAAEAERIRAEKKMELQRQLAEKRAALEKRPEGMSKLKRD